MVEKKKKVINLNTQTQADVDRFVAEAKAGVKKPETIDLRKPKKKKESFVSKLGSNIKRVFTGGSVFQGENAPKDLPSEVVEAGVSLIPGGSGVKTARGLGAGGEKLLKIPGISKLDSTLKALKDTGILLKSNVLKRTNQIDDILKGLRFASAGKSFQKAGFVQRTQIFKTPTGKLTSSASGRLGELTQQFPANAKAVGLTEKIFNAAIGTSKGIGKALASPAGLIAIIGSYPFAGFINEESLQTIGFASSEAIKIGDVEGAQEALELEAALLDETTWESIAKFVPFANVWDKLLEFRKTAVKNVELKTRRLLELERDRIDEGEFESAFEQSAREREEATTARDTEFEERRQEDIERSEATTTSIEESRRLTAERDEARTIEFEQNQQAILNAQLASEERFKQAQAERDETKAAQAQEDTLFFEALRKRNAGQPLTDEEVQRLEARGIDTKARVQTERSGLDFGLLR